MAGLEQWVRNMALPMVAHLPRPASGKSALYEEGKEGEVSGVHFTTVEQMEGQGRRQLIPEKSQQEDLNFKLLKLKEFLHPKIRERKGKGFLKQCFTANHVLLLAAATNALILYLGKNFPHSWAGVVLRAFISLQLVCGQHKRALLLLPLTSRAIQREPFLTLSLGQAILSTSVQTFLLS